MLGAAGRERLSAAPAVEAWGGGALINVHLALAAVVAGEAAAAEAALSCPRVLGLSTIFKTKSQSERTTKCLTVWRL